MTEAQKQKLLQQYIDGSIDSNNRHLLEREALDDPFLFDALEGYSIEAIQTSIQDRAPKKERLQILTYVSMAASFLLIAGVAYLFNVNFNADSNADLMAIDQEVEALSGDQAAVASNEESTTEFSPNLQSEQVQSTPKPSIEPSYDKTNYKNENPKKGKSIKVTSGTQDLANDDVQINKGKSVETQTPEQATLITNTSQEEIAYAGVTVSEDSKDAVEDVESTVQAEFDNDTSNPSNEEAALGGQTEEETYETEVIENGDELAYEEGVPSAKMNKSQSNNDAAIENSASRRSKTLADKPTEELLHEEDFNDGEIEEMSKAESFRKSFPTGGMDKFQEYLEENRLDEDCSQGTITFKFLILPDGTLDEVEIIDDDALNGLSPKVYADCERAAKELLIDYGLWDTVPANRKVRRIWKYIPPTN